MSQKFNRCFNQELLALTNICQHKKTRRFRPGGIQKSPSTYGIRQGLWYFIIRSSLRTKSYMKILFPIVNPFFSYLLSMYSEKSNQKDLIFPCTYEKRGRRQEVSSLIITINPRQKRYLFPSAVVQWWQTHDAILQVNLAKMFPCVNSNPLKDSSNCSCTNFFPGSGENHQRCQSVNPTQKTKAANIIIIVTGCLTNKCSFFFKFFI